MIQQHHGVVIAPVALGPILSVDVRVERPDMPRGDADDVSQFRVSDGGTIHTRYRWPSRAAPMRAYIVEISAKLIIRSDTDPEQLPADIYSQITEFIRNDDDLLDLEVHAVPLPADLSGSAPH